MRLILFLNVCAEICDTAGRSRGGACTQKVVNFSKNISTQLQQQLLSASICYTNPFTMWAPWPHLGFIPKKLAGNHQIICFDSNNQGYYQGVLLIFWGVLSFVVFYSQALRKISKIILILFGFLSETINCLNFFLLIREL